MVHRWDRPRLQPCSRYRRCCDQQPGRRRRLRALQRVLLRKHWLGGSSRTMHSQPPSSRPLRCSVYLALCRAPKRQPRTPQQPHIKPAARRTSTPKSAAIWTRTSARSRMSQSAASWRPKLCPSCNASVRPLIRAFASPEARARQVTTPCSAPKPTIHRCVHSQR